jgi:hypothetical protein
MERVESVRHPAQFRARVIAQFRSPQNLGYLRTLFASQPEPLRSHALATLWRSALDFSESTGRGAEVLAQDPLALRGAARPAVNLWSELRRLNRAYYMERLASLRTAGRGGAPHHLRAIEEDSLRPPGLSHLNPEGGLAPEAAPYGAADAPWRPGDPGRTPAQAAAEYWGDSWVASDEAGPEGDGEAYASCSGWASAWQKENGGRPMRREAPPFWQRGGRGGLELDIDETLGSAPLELGTHVRRWDMGRVRSPRGRDTRRYGPRSG